VALVYVMNLRQVGLREWAVGHDRHSPGAHALVAYCAGNTAPEFCFESCIFADRTLQVPPLAIDADSSLYIKEFLKGHMHAYLPITDNFASDFYGCKLTEPSRLVSWVLSWDVTRKSMRQG
jgi:hypothetical protein